MDRSLAPGTGRRRERHAQKMSSGGPHRLSRAFGRFGIRILALILPVTLAFGGFPPAPVAAAGPILYAQPSATGTGDCLSWANACTLQAALGTAVSGNEIWVAQGTHTPTTGTDRAVSFALKDGVGVYGGFAGDETTRDARNWATRATILNGDIGAPGITSDNSYHVVSSPAGTSATAILDGFTVSGGSASGALDQSEGGGLRLVGSPTLRNLVIAHNTATYGGGVDVRGNPSFTNVVIRDNGANYGGGMCTESGAPVLTNVTLYGNSSALYDRGAAIFVFAPATVTGTNLVVWANSPVEGQIYPTSLAGVTYSNVQYSSTGTGNISTDPQFVNAAAGDLHLRSTSPAVNAGNSSAVPAGVSTDLDGNPRIAGSAVDMGAYEFQPGPMLESPTSSAIGSTTALLGGTVASDNGATVTERGIVYSPTAANSNPRIGGTGVARLVAGSTGTGAFTVAATGLTASTAYSFAAYAINSQGTGYSVVGTFTTVAPGSYVVSTTADAGGGSFRQAILDANAHANVGGADTISFAIPTSDAGYNGTNGVWTIRPTSALPTIGEAVVINGYSQPGAAEATSTSAATIKIELDGSSAGASTTGLYFNAASNIVKGLAIRSFGN